MTALAQSKTSLSILNNHRSAGEYRCIQCLQRCLAKLTIYGWMQENEQAGYEADPCAQQFWAHFLGQIPVILSLWVRPLVHEQDPEILKWLYGWSGEMDRQISAVSAVMQTLYQAIVVKRALSRTAKISIYPSIWLPVHELWKIKVIHSIDLMWFFIGWLG